MNEFVRMEVSAILDDDEIYCNDEFQVNIKFFDKKLKYAGWLWLSIKRKDKESIHDWRKLQQIKNMLAGKEREAVELYPAESRLVDSSNQYHLFVLPEGEKFPMGFTERLIVKGHKGGWRQGSGQRDFKKEEEPADALDPDKIPNFTVGVFGGKNNE